jgi:general stress protein YciG
MNDVKKKGGFASMDPDRQRTIASKGGKAAHAQGVAYEFDKESAREAGRKGGFATAFQRRYTAEVKKLGRTLTNAEVDALKRELETDRADAG